MREIKGSSINSLIKQFWCKRCKIATDVIYKDEDGNSYCDNCVNLSNESKISKGEVVIKEEVKILEKSEEIIKDVNTASNKRNKRAVNNVRKERKLF